FLLTLNKTDIASAVEALHNDLVSRYKSGCDWENPVQLYEQSFMFVITIGYWLDPIRSLNGDEKSELLLVNLGIISDVLEFLEMSKEIRKGYFDFIFENSTRELFVWLTLSLWTLSLVQFILVIKESKEGSKSWGVWLSLLLMDVPYL
ncbi:unnamed protein product, partial [Meganyctiphanes norvegica]